MKPLFIFCSACCFLGIFRLPIEYYTFLRIVVSLGAILAIYNFFKIKNYYWLIIFVAVLVLFNPVFPIYLHRKSIWVPIDTIVGLLFLLFAFFQKKEEEEKQETIEIAHQEKTYSRDRIIRPKNDTKNHNK